jgi:hypothetical protein
MAFDQHLRSSPPTGLDAARALAHRAAQLVTMAARVNLSAVADDSHSNLGWGPETQSFASHPLDAGDTQIQVALSINPLRLDLTRNGQRSKSLKLDGLSHANALDWLDTQLVRVGLAAASQSTLPYDLPEDVSNLATYDVVDIGDQLTSLAAWFDTAHGVLSDFVSGLIDIRRGAGPVRCWPHHFDMATYVELEQGPSEMARGIGVGMSPGDESYNQPYFYVNPWPHLEPTNLPPAPQPGHWHRTGFVGAIATGAEILHLGDIQSELSQFVTNAFEIGHGQLGA